MRNVVIMGRLGADPELKYLSNGTPVVNIRIADNEAWKTANGEKREKTHWIGAFAFGKTAENINKFFSKGRRILISGSLDYQEWTNNEGSKRSKLEVKIFNFEFVESRGDGETRGGTDERYRRRVDNASATRDERQPVSAGDDEIPF